MPGGLQITRPGGSVGNWGIGAPSGVGGGSNYGYAGNQAPSGYMADPNNVNQFIHTGAGKGADAGAALTGLQNSLTPELRGLLFGADTTQAGGSGARAGAGAHMPNVPGIDTSAAVASAFGRAKDKIGLQARGALTGLSNAMAARGITGGGLMSNGIANVVNNSENNLADVDTGQAVKDAELAQRNAETNYQGGITQRGQDVTNRGNELAQNNYLMSQRRQTIQGLLSAFGGIY